MVAGLADTVAVMYAGRIIERGAAAEILARPAHPYTVGLLNSAPGRNARGRSLFQIPGSPPNLLEAGPGCAFVPRCARAGAACAAMPSLDPAHGREVRCFHPQLQIREAVAA